MTKLIHYVTPRNLYRFGNGVIAAGALYHLCTNPEATIAELGPDILMHGFEAICPNRFNNLAATANFIRSYQALHFSINSWGCVSPTLNFSDYFLHGCIATKRINFSVPNIVLFSEGPRQPRPRVAAQGMYSSSSTDELVLTKGKIKRH